jgi:hypothetical protein
MSEGRRRWLWAVLGLAVVVGLPVLGHWARRSAVPHCALDGVEIDPRYQVSVVDGRGQAHAFCCLHCAQAWVARQPDTPRAITVTDEATGQEIEAASACYVRSSVVTTPVTGNRIHAFRRRADAEEHASAFSGVVLTGAEKPFR